MSEKVLLLTTREDLIDVIREVVKDNNMAPPLDFAKDRRTRYEAAKFCRISLTTLDNHTKTGIFKRHGTGRKVFYLESELVKSLKNQDK